MISDVSLTCIRQPVALFITLAVAAGSYDSVFENNNWDWYDK